MTFHSASIARCDLRQYDDEDLEQQVPSQWLPWQEAEWDLLTNNPNGRAILTGLQSGVGRTLIVDVEGDGILHASGGKKAVTQFWCIAAIDVDTGDEFYWGVDQGPDSLRQCAKFLQEAECLLAHYGIGYDYPAMERIFPGWHRPAKSWDTMVVSKIIWPPETLMDRDMGLYNKGLLPGHLLKAHSLKAWGIRTGTHKGEYGPKKGEEGYGTQFDAWCPAMADYLMGDVRATLALWKLCLKRLGWKDPLPGQLVWRESTVETECEVARIIFQQTEYGVRFDMPKAHALAAALRNEQARIERELVETFGSWWEPLDDVDTGRIAGSTMQRKLTEHPDITIPRVGKHGQPLAPYVGPPVDDITEGAASVRVERTTFNPSNRHHIAKRLQAVFGWKPKAFGKTGVATVDEGTLEEIPDAVMPATTRQLLLDYFVITKTLTSVAGRTKTAWISRAEGDGRIHGEMDTTAAITRRGTHKNPNLSGCPKVMLEKDAQGNDHPVHGLRGRYGWECRELFQADEGWELTGVDASSLELIDLGHYLWPLDGGAFSSRVCDPARDAHREHAEIAGSGMSRADAKTTIYLKVYGGGAYKLSLALDLDDGEIPSLLNYKGLPALLNALRRRFDDDFVLKLDDRQRAKIAKAQTIIKKLEGVVVGLNKLTDRVKESASKGWLKAIDGSYLHVRKAFAALNALLQSAGAISCKTWMVLFHREMARRGYVIGRDWKQVIWCHDELQITHKPGMGPVIKEVAEETLVKAGEMLGLKGRYRTSGTTGSNWATTH